MNNEKIHQEIDASASVITARYRKRLEAERSERKRERRERIATAALAGVLANPDHIATLRMRVDTALQAADALIAELDKQP